MMDWLRYKYLQQTKAWNIYKVESSVRNKALATSNLSEFLNMQIDESFLNLGDELDSDERS